MFSGIWDRLLINSKPNSRKTTTLQTVRIERSPREYLLPSLVLPDVEFLPIRLLGQSLPSWSELQSPVEQVLNCESQCLKRYLSEKLSRMTIQKPRTIIFGGWAW